MTADAPVGGLTEDRASLVTEVAELLTEHMGHTVYEATEDQPAECHDECPACFIEDTVRDLAAREAAARAEALREAVEDFHDYADRVDRISTTRAAHWRDGAARLRARADALSADAPAPREAERDAGVRDADVKPSDVRKVVSTALDEVADNLMPRPTSDEWIAIRLLATFDVRRNAAREGGR